MKLSAMLKGAMVVALAGVLFASPPLREFASSLKPDLIEPWLSQAGVFAPLLFMVIMAIAVVVSPIPSLPLDITAGLCPESCGVWRCLPSCGLRRQRTTEMRHAACRVFEASISATWG